MPADSPFHSIHPILRTQLLVGTTVEPTGCVETALPELPRPVAPHEAPALKGQPALMQTIKLIPRLEGRCRVALRFKPALRGGQDAAGSERPPEIIQYVHLMVLAPAVQVLQRHGDFASNVAWLPANVSDPWSRSPAFFGSDAEARGGKGAALVEEPRVFMAGMSDESGASAPLAMAVKQLGLPTGTEIAKLEEYVFGTLWAGESGDRKRFLQGKDYSVRLSMLYWSDSIDSSPNGAASAFAPSLYTHCHKCWAGCSKRRDCCYWMHCWSEEHSLETWRAYNYPHVTTVYWSLYRLARHYEPPPTKRADWRWYLEQAARTAIAMSKFGGRGTSQWGLMVGSTFATVLRDLRREGMDGLADELEAAKQRRMNKWLSMIFPYGSEFPWDSTGHEEIHTWLLHDGRLRDANRTVQAVLAYSTVLPHWAYCGSARRYWDFTINGKTQWGNEREFHHYGSTLNAVAVLDAYRAYPRRYYLLQLGACSLLGHLSNIHPNGAASMAWHGDPGLLKRDGFSGDYGPGLYGYYRSASSYLTCMPPNGWVCALCDVQEGEPAAEQQQPPGGASSDRSATPAGCNPHALLRIIPRDALRRRAYLAPLGLSILVEGAYLAEVTLVPADLSMSIVLRPHAAAPSARATLFLEAESIEPPPPLPAAGYVVRCAQGQAVAGSGGCTVKQQAVKAAVGSKGSEYVVGLTGSGLPTRLSIRP